MGSYSLFLFQMKQDSVKLQEICTNCKTKLVDFFIFKKQAEEARKIFKESSAFETVDVKDMLLEVVDQIDSSLEQSIEEKCDDLTAEKENSDEDESEFVEDDGEHDSDIKEEIEKLIEAEEVEKLMEVEEVETLMEIEEVVGTFESETSLEILEHESDHDLSEISASASKRKAVRQANPESWLRNKRKIAKNSGQSYYASNGKLVQAKEIRDNCGETCRMQCSKKITVEGRLENFYHFYSLGDIEKQRLFLFERMKTYEPKRSKNAKNPQKLRAVQRSYFLDITKTEALQVCKLMFLNTFSISSQMIDTLYRKAITEGQFNDIRGKFPRKR